MAVILPHMTMDPTRQLERDLKDIVRHAPGRLSIQVVGPQGILAGWDADRQVPAASLIKVLVLLATLHEVDRGRLSLDQQLQVPARRVGGAGALSLLPTITELSVIELLRLMITLSDNDAANLLLQLLGHERVTRCATDLGLTQTVVQRDLMDPAAAESGRDNLTTAADQAGLLAVLRSGHAVGSPRPGSRWRCWVSSSMRTASRLCSRTRSSGAPSRPTCRGCVTTSR